METPNHEASTQSQETRSELQTYGGYPTIPQPIPVVVTYHPLPTPAPETNRGTINASYTRLESQDEPNKKKRCCKKCCKKCCCCCCKSIVGLALFVSCLLCLLVLGAAAAFGVIFWQCVDPQSVLESKTYPINNGVQNIFIELTHGRVTLQSSELHSGYIDTYIYTAEWEKHNERNRDSYMIDNIQANGTSVNVTVLTPVWKIFESCIRNEIIVTLPNNSNINIFIHGGDVEINAIAANIGNLIIDSGSLDISLNDVISHNVNVSMQFGSAFMAGVQSKQIITKAITADVSINQPTTPLIDVEVNSGKIKVEYATSEDDGSITARVLESGTIELTQNSNFNIESYMKNGPTTISVSASQYSGSFLLEGESAPFVSGNGKYHIDSSADNRVNGTIGQSEGKGVITATSDSGSISMVVNE